MRHSCKYQAEIKSRGLKPGRFLSVRAAEFLSGLPPNWTSPEVASVKKSCVDEHHEASKND